MAGTLHVVSKPEFLPWTVTPTESGELWERDGSLTQQTTGSTVGGGHLCAQVSRSGPSDSSWKGGDGGAVRETEQGTSPREDTVESERQGRQRGAAYSFYPGKGNRKWVRMLPRHWECAKSEGIPHFCSQRTFP